MAPWRSVDDTAARKAAGVLDLVALPALKSAPRLQPLDGIVVVATNTWAGTQRRSALRISWLPGKGTGTSSTDALATQRDPVQTNRKVKRAVGNAERALAESPQVISATDEVPHLAHAPMSATASPLTPAS